MINEPRRLLGRLAAGDEASLETVLWPGIASDAPHPPSLPSLDTRTRLLVRLAALLALDASTESLRWAIDLAAAAGASDDALAAVLVASGEAAGSAQLAGGASSLALALGIDPAGDGRPAPVGLLP